ncbi:amidase [Micromonospora sp. B11E3]|uniref:amidase n=1 Tax=Micromonospora sp. B11E3 TaxID=3153562 RepID=UPI00325EF04B
MQIPTIAEASTLIAARELSPVELVEQCLSRIEALDSTLNSFITLTPERALTEAKAAEGRMMAGELRGRLDGIPIAHKDIFNTRGIPTTANSRVLEGWLPSEDAQAVARWAEAGTSMLGKLTLHEFALGGPSFDLPWPPARNPWNPDHFTSGSSSGTAAAIAAGLILGGSGSDTGGSIREPASMCGISGIKPTYGLCSRRGILPLAPSLDHPGPMAWTAEDCALLLQAMAGHDPADPASVNRPVPDFSAGLGQGVKGLRIGVAREWHESESPVSQAAQKGIDNALAVWSEQGAEITELAMPSLREYQELTLIILTCEAYAFHEQNLRRRLHDYGEILRDRLALGALLTSADYLQALRRRSNLCARTANATSDVDVIVTAGVGSEAARIDSVSKWGHLANPGFTKPFNLTGWPAISVCSGYGEGGLPVAVQIATRPFGEPLLFPGPRRCFFLSGLVMVC